MKSFTEREVIHLENLYETSKEINRLLQERDRREIDPKLLKKLNRQVKAVQEVLV